MADKDFVVEFGSFQEVLDGYASQLSEEGIFFETTENQAVGSELAFEVRIRDSFSVLRGEGEIVQVTDDGVLLRLVYLDQPSLKLLPKLLEHYRRRGVPLLELPEETPSSEDPAGEVMDAEPAATEVQAEVEEADGEPDEAGVDASAASLTLDDLEAEFLGDSDQEAAEAVVDSIAAQEPVDAEMVVESMDHDGIDEEAEIEDIPGNDELAEGGEATDEPITGLLLDPDVLPTEPATDDQDSDADDIHLDQLLDPEGEVEVEALAVEADLEAPPVDSGLPWLPEEPEKKGRKDLWVILVLILVGAALGAAFYFFFLRPKATSSWRPAAPATIQAQALPAASPKSETTPLPVQARQPSPELDIEPVSPSSDSAEPRTVEPSPRAHDPPAEVLTGVDRITWVDEAGETVITFWGDGLFVADLVDDFRVLGGAPREVVRIRGVRRPFSEQRVQLDTDHVVQIRVGLHEEEGGSALHFVADLVDPDVEILRTEASGEQLRVYFSKAG